MCRTIVAGDREITASRKGRVPELTKRKEERRKAQFLQRDCGQQVAIVGLPPAGLSFAWDLANVGYEPVVFEAPDAARRDAGCWRVPI